ncbi:MAG: transglycosylase domain-containing protein, partial [Lachnospiraceae bacterium]|nr:transglycosylase domain-containing protein [Lachnospiraceae bacterium]
MNYSKKGIRKKQRKLNSKSTKFGKLFLLTFMKAFLACILAVIVIGGCMGIGMFKGILASAPDISSLNVVPSGYATVVYDANGKQITKLISENSNRSYVSRELIPQDLADAFVAVEDQRFYEHNGIDIYGIGRAGVKALKEQNLSEGASTITQQLLKNNVFENWTNETKIQSIKRKIQEQYLAIALEKQYTEKLGKQEAKETILELYMNSINLGQGTLGVQAASMRYFNKPVSQLSLSECAVIAAITQNPSKYNPISHPEYNAERRKKVLEDMEEQGYITEGEKETALADNVYNRIASVNEVTSVQKVNSYFVDALTEQVIEVLKEEKGYNETQAYNLLYSGGLSIYTTQDPKIQEICDEVFSNEENYPSNVKWYLNYELTVQKYDDTLENHSTEMLKSYFKNSNPNFNLIFSSKDDAYAAIEEYKASVMSAGDAVYGENVTLTPQPQVSITVMDQHTGYVVAMVGGRGAKTASRTLNRATNTTRQPGSTFKVVSTYAPALDSAGLTLATVQNDAPYNYADGRPVSNWYGNNYKGLCSIRYGIEQSLNIVAVKTLTQITPQLGFDYLENFGFTTLVESRETESGILSDITQSLGLGGLTDGVTNMELNAAYAAIANNGTYNKPTLFTQIIDHDGNVLIDHTTPENHQVIKETTAYLLTDAMTDVVTKGTGASVNFNSKMAIAGKTGTTSNYVDVWFAGYTPYYTATTWAGFDNNVHLSTSQEKNLAKTLWRTVMSRIHENLENKNFEKPEDIVTATVCSKSGLLPIAGVCNGTLTTEYFAKGTVPTDTCNVHYQGQVCTATGKAAVPTCPYQVPGVLTIPPDEEGNSAISYCEHTPEYFSNPSNLPNIAAQQQQMQQQQQ